MAARLTEFLRKATASPLQFVTTSSLTADEIAVLFGEIALTEEESLIVNALKLVDPSIERVGAAPSGVLGRNSLVVRCTGQPDRIPLGSMGDGTWRMLGLALALVNVRGGILLVDEIDTGLHYSVMAKMWKLVCQTAERLDVQVFATSHSRDCFESLAAVIQDGQTGGASVGIHRIERDQGRSIALGEEAIVIAAERGIEIR